MIGEATNRNGAKRYDPDQLPPESLNAEQAVLGSMLEDALALEFGLNLLKPEDFYRDGHQCIFRVMGDLSERESAVDVVTVTNELRNRGWLGVSLEMNYVYDLPNTVATPANVEYYAEIVKRKATDRKVIELGEDVRAIGQSGASSAAMYAIADQLVTLAPKEKAEAKETAKDCLRRVYLEVSEREEKKEFIGVQTGYRSLNRLIGGFLPGLDILGARPSIGKTSMALSIGFQVAHWGRVHLISLEQTVEQLAYRLLSISTGYGSLEMQMGVYQQAHQQEKLLKSYTALDALNFDMEFCSGLSLPELKRKVKRLKRDEGVEWLVIDYINLLSVPGIRDDNETAKMNIRAEALRDCAKENDLPVFALAQLNRDVEKRPDKRPIMSDLRDSGALEFHADRIYFLHRPSWQKKGISVDDDAELIVEKNRIAGGTGYVPLHFNRISTHFFEPDTYI